MSITLLDTQFPKINLNETKINNTIKSSNAIPKNQQNINFAGHGDVFVKPLGEGMSKTKRFLSEVLEIIGSSTRMLWKDGKELPVSKKPKIAKSRWGDYPAHVIALVEEYNRKHPDHPISVPDRNAPISVLESAERKALSHHEDTFLDETTNFGGERAQHGDGLTPDGDDLQITDGQDMPDLKDFELPETPDIDSIDITDHTDDILGHLGDFLDHLL